MKRAFIGFLLISICLLLKACDTAEPPGDKPTLNLKLEDVSCTEAWIKLSSTNLQLPAAITLKQTNPTGETKSQILNLNTQDSLLYIDSLLPNKSYQYQVSSIQCQVSSNELSVTTMDTTSHDFIWQQFTFGEHNPSTLYDVAILNENFICAVGEIYMNDTLGQQDQQPYGVVIWDGQSWSLKKLFYNINVTVTPRGILVINPNEIYLAAGSIFRWDGVSSTVQMVFSRLSLSDPNGTIEKLWGNSGSSIYGIGNVGSIVYYNGQSWQQMESGTDVDLLDVWGSPDGSVVWACGLFWNKPGTYLLRSRGGNFETAFDGTNTRYKILNDTVSGSMTSVYTPNEKQVFIGTTAGIYSAPATTLGEGKRLSFTPTFFPGFPHRLRGNGVNDLTIVGDYSFIGHYNGYSWRYFDELWSDNISLLSVAQRGNLIVAVGYQYLLPYFNPAVIFVGRR